jgi:hypothetical protein
MPKQFNTLAPIGEAQEQRSQSVCLPGDQAVIPEVLRPLSESLLLETAAPEHLTRGIHEVLSGKRVLPSMGECERYAADNYA